VPNNQSNTRIYVGAVSLSKTNAMYFFRNQAEGKYKQVKFCLGPEGRGKLGTYFLVFKDPETNMPTNILVLFGSTRLSEVTHIFYSVVKAEGNQTWSGSIAGPGPGPGPALFGGTRTFGSGSGSFAKTRRRPETLLITSNIFLGGFLNL